MSEAGKVSLPVTVARLPEEAIAELDERIGELWNKEAGDFEEDTELISDDMMGNFNLLVIGYDAAWSEVERLSAALEEAQQEVEEWQDEAKQWRDDFIEKNNELAEAQQQAERWSKDWATEHRSRNEAEQQVLEEKKWRKVEHEVAGGYHRDLVEAQQTIETLRLAKDYEIELHTQSCTEYQQTIARLRQKIDAALSWTWNCGEENMLEVIAALKDEEGETQP